jgi:hypothetical protein
MLLIDFILSAIQLQSEDSTETPSPEMLKVIADLMNAGHPPASSWISPEGLEAITGFIIALAWPLLAGFVIYRVRPQLAAILNGIHDVEFGRVKARIKTELNESADQAAPGLSSGPSNDELRRAAKVNDLAKHDIALIRQQVDGLGFEYDSLRGLLPSGDKRNRLMEKVVSKMRTIGRAAFAIRYELKASPSPGHRLQAVACLQVLTDWELLDWLARCVREESRFIAYHALIALLAATEQPNARKHLKKLETAAIESGQDLHEGSDRWKAWRRLMDRVAALKGRAQQTSPSGHT